LTENFFEGYKICLPDSATFAEYAIDHLNRLLGSKMLVDSNNLPMRIPTGRISREDGN
jgi:hypothetical protein